MATTRAIAMQRALPGAEFAAWFDCFLPHVAAKLPTTLFEPAVVSDRGDGAAAETDLAVSLPTSPGQRRRTLARQLRDARARGIGSGMRAAASR
jgi:hypothetical protein